MSHRKQHCLSFLSECMVRKSWWLDVSTVLYRGANTSQGSPRDNVRPAGENLALRLAKSGL